MPNKKVVLTYYYTGEADFWHPELKEIKKPDRLDFLVLRKSVAQFPNYDFHTLTNEFQPDWDHTKITKPEELTFYTYKFIAMRNWIREHPEYEEIWLVDTSDTQLLRDIDMEKDLIYTGLDCYSRRRNRYQTVRTMINGGFRKFKHNSATHRELQKFGYKPCYNCGVCGGHREILLEFLDELCDRLETFQPATEMVEFNWVLFHHFQDRTRLCTTKLETWSIDNAAVWRHK